MAGDFPWCALCIYNSKKWKTKWQGLKMPGRSLFPHFQQSKAAPLKCKRGERLSLKGDRVRKQKRESKGESGQETAGSKVVPLEWHGGQRLSFTQSSWLASPICCWWIWGSCFASKDFRDKVIDKKWIYLEKNTLHRHSVGHVRRGEVLKYGVVSFYGLGKFIS